MKRLNNEDCNNSTMKKTKQNTQSTKDSIFQTIMKRTRQLNRRKQEQYNQYNAYQFMNRYIAQQKKHIENSDNDKEEKECEKEEDGDDEYDIYEMIKKNRDSYSSKSNNNSNGNNSNRQQSVFDLLSSLITENDKKIVIRSARATAETDYENILHRENAISRLCFKSNNNNNTEEYVIKEDGNIIPFNKIEPKVKLWPYQEEAVQFLLNRDTDKVNIGTKGAMLCDEMGLGKTIETLIYILKSTQRLYIQYNKRFNGVTLIVLPKLVINTWINEIEKSLPPNTLHYVKLLGDNNTVPTEHHINNCIDIIFTTYTVVSLAYKSIYGSNTTSSYSSSRYKNKKNKTTKKNDNRKSNKQIIKKEDGGEEEYDYNDYNDDEEDDNEKLNKEEKECVKSKYQFLYHMKFRKLIADEGHKIVNKTRLVFRAMNSLDAESRLIITGTPIQNRLLDIYTHLEFIKVPMHLLKFDNDNKRSYSSSSSSLSNNEEYDTNKNKKKKNKRSKAYRLTISNNDKLRLKDILNKVMIRRLKSHIISIDNESDKPTLNQIDHKIEIIDFDTKTERILYLMYAYYGIDKMNNAINNNNHIKMNITSVISLMRQCCIDYRIISNHIIPNGMLSMNNEFMFVSSSIKDDYTINDNITDSSIKQSFNDAIYYNESESWVDYRKQLYYNETNNIHDYKKELLVQGYNLNKHSIFKYTSYLSKSDDTDNIDKEKDDKQHTYEWNPYRYEKVENNDDIYQQLLYKRIYDIMYKIRNEEKREALFEDIIQSFKNIEDEYDEQSIKKIYNDIIDRLLPLYSTKAKRILKYIKEEIVDDTDKIMIFSDSVRALKLMKSYLAINNIKSCILTGDTTKNYGNNTIEQFQTDPTIKVILLSLKLCNVGINIICANHILFINEWWNPFIQLQAEYRNQRIGQKKTVYIRYFIIKDTIEEYVYELTSNKKFISNIIEKDTYQHNKAISSLDVLIHGSNNNIESSLSTNKYSSSSSSSSSVSHIRDIERENAKLENETKSRLFDFKIILEQSNY